MATPKQFCRDNITWRQQVTAMLFASPMIIGFCVFMAIPLGMSLYYSFCDYTMLQKPLWVGGDNYANVWSDIVFWKALKNTLFYGLISVPCSLAISLLLAVLLNQPVPGRGLFRTLIFLPTLVPAVASAMLWLVLLNSKTGLINTLLNPLLALLGLTAPGWLQSTTWAMPAIIFMSFWSVGHTVVILLAGLQDVPVELYESAALDGCNGWQRFWNITLPTLSPVIFFNLVMGVIGIWQVFSVPYILTGGGPERSTLFYNMYLYQTAFTELRMGYASALAWIQLLIIVVLTTLVFRTARKWVHY